jgi:putative protease
LLGKEIRIEKPDFKVRPGDRVFIAAIKENKFPAQIKDFVNHKKNIAENRNLFSKLNIIKNQQAQQQTKIFMRVDHIDWLKKIHFDSIDALILHLDIKDYENSFLENKFFMKNQHKIWIELPRFISELSAIKYQELIRNLQRKAYNRFFISHISQMEYMPENAVVATNEHVYVLNDFAAMFLKEQRIEHFIYPLECGVDNLIQSKNKTGILPFYYYPELFYSRQPIKATDKILDDEQRVFSKRIKDNMTVVIPEFPVSLLQYANKLKAKGFRNFLIDLSYEKPSQNLAKKLIKRFQSSAQIQPSDNFNFKRGLK